MNTTLDSKLLAVLDEAFVTVRMLLQINHLAAAEKILEDFAYLPTILRQKRGWEIHLRDFVFFAMPRYLDAAYPDRSLQRTVKEFKKAYVTWAVRHSAAESVPRPEAADRTSKGLHPRRSRQSAENERGQSRTF